VQALIWPLFVIQYRPPIGILALAIAFAVFPRTLERPIELWLFGEEVPNKVPGAPADRPDDDRSD